MMIMVVIEEAAKMFKVPAVQSMRAAFIIFCKTARLLCATEM